MASDKPARRRNYDDALKARISGECEMPGTSVAKVALAHGINANAAHHWRQLLREGAPSAPAISTGFVPVSLAAAPAPIASDDIQVELRRGAMAMKSGPTRHTEP